jgi:hypothetical protein
VIDLISSAVSAAHTPSVLISPRRPEARVDRVVADERACVVAVVRSLDRAVVSGGADTVPDVSVLVGVDVPEHDASRTVVPTARTTAGRCLNERMRRSLPTRPRLVAGAAAPVP